MEPITIGLAAVAAGLLYKATRPKAATVVVPTDNGQKVVDLQQLTMRAMMSRDPAKCDAVAKELESLNTVEGDAAALALHAFADQLRKGTVVPDKPIPAAPSGGKAATIDAPTIADASKSAEAEAPVNPFLSTDRVQYAKQLAVILSKYSKATAGPKTRAQIAAFQKSEGLKADGLYGKNTRAALVSVLTNAGFSESSVPAAYY